MKCEFCFDFVRQGEWEGEWEGEWLGPSLGSTNKAYGHWSSDVLDLLSFVFILLKAV